MDSTSPRHLPIILLLGLSELVVSASDLCAQEVKDSITVKGLTLEVKVVPADPFHPLFQANAKGNSIQIRRGEMAKLVITGTPQPGFYTYPLTKRAPQQVQEQLWSLKYEGNESWLPLGPVLESEPDLVFDKDANHDLLKHLRPFTWEQDVVILPAAKPGTLMLGLQLRGQVCDKNSCFPIPSFKLAARAEISPENPLSLSPEMEKRTLDAQAKQPKKVSPPDVPVVAIPSKDAPWLISKTHEDTKAVMENLAGRIVLKFQTTFQEKSDLIGFILAGIFWGAVSLITPCVFPMIPITVSFFLKQSEKDHHRPFQMALVYSVTIVVVLTIAAMFLLSTFRWLSINPLMNYGLGLLFVFFALSLFGMYDIELPSGLARFTSAREGQGGTVGTIFMALTFTIISFACVAPFLGGFGGTAATQERPLWHYFLGGLAFSVTFASPFFVLALFPALLRKMPKSGSWLNAVKVVMGFMELAAAFKFFRSAELVRTSAPTLFTFDFVLGVWIALCFLCGLYLLGFYRLPHDTPEEHIGVPRMLFSGLFIALGFYLLPALFKVDAEGLPQRPGGSIYAWIDSFLLPEMRPTKGDEAHGNLDYAIAQAREHRIRTGQPKRVFIDFTGKS